MSQTSTGYSPHEENNNSGSTGGHNGIDKRKLRVKTMNRVAHHQRPLLIQRQSRQEAMPWKFTVGCYSGLRLRSNRDNTLDLRDMSNAASRHGMKMIHQVCACVCVYYLSHTTVRGGRVSFLRTCFAWLGRSQRVLSVSVRARLE